MTKKHRHDWYLSDMTNSKDGTGPAEETCAICKKTRKITVEKYNQ